MRKRAIILSTLIVLVLSACNFTQNGVLPASVSATPVSSATPSSTATPEATATPVPTPTLALPVRDGTPIPTPNPSVALSADIHFREVARLGQGRIVSSAWSPDGNLIFVSNLSGFSLYRYPDLQVTASVVPYTPVSHPVFSPDGKRLVFIGEELELWDVETLTLIQKQAVPAVCLGLSYDPESGNIVGVFRADETAPLTRMVWDAELQQNISSTSYEKLDDLNITVSSDLSLAVNRLTPSVYYVWDLVNDQELLSTDFPINDYKGRYACEISMNKRYLLLCEYGNIAAFDLQTQSVTQFTTAAGNFQPIQQIGEARFILKDTLSNQYALFDVPQNQILFSGQVLEQPLAVDATQQRFIDGAGKIYALADGPTISVVGQIESYRKACCAVSPQGSYLAGWEGNRLQLLSTVDGAPIARLEVAETNPADLLQFTPAEDKLVWLNSSGATLEIFSIPDLTPVASIPLAPIQIDRDLAFYSMPISPDGSYLALSAFADDFLLIVDLDQGKIARTFQGRYMDSIFHPSGILAVRFSSPRGEESILKIDPQTGATVGSLPGHQLISIALDGTNLVILTSHGLMIENWENGISGSLKENIAAPIYDALASLATSLNMKPEGLLQTGKIVLEQNRIYLNEGNGYFRIFELVP